MQREKPVMKYNPKKILNIDFYLGERFSVLEKIGQGSFGDIYKVFDKEKNQLGAVKLERKDKKGPEGMLLKEAKILTELAQQDYFPKYIHSSSQKDYDYIIMQYLGPNLEHLKRKQGGYLSLKTVLLIGIQMIQDLENLHEAHYIHRDIKPENFVIGTEGNHHCVFLIDFGLSKKYIDEKGQHIPFVEKKGLVGTARYTSINSHLGSEQSRRDDLESLGYILLYFIKGFLPWQNFQCSTRNEKFRKILETKVAISVEELCEGIPDEFIKFFKHVRHLKFDEKPDYEMLKNLFYKSLQNLFGTDKLCFDWCQSSCNIDYFPGIKKFRTQSMTQNNTDFKDIEERKNGEDQIKLPYIDVPYPVRMSQMNQSMIYGYQSFQNGQPRQSKNNFSSISFTNNPCTDSKQVFFGEVSNYQYTGLRSNTKNGTRNGSLFDEENDNITSKTLNQIQQSKQLNITNSNIIQSQLQTKYASNNYGSQKNLGMNVVHEEEGGQHQQQKVTSVTETDHNRASQKNKNLYQQFNNTDSQLVNNFNSNQYLPDQNQLQNNSNNVNSNSNNNYNQSKENIQ